MGLSKGRIPWKEDSFRYINTEVSELYMRPYSSEVTSKILEKNSEVSRGYPVKSE